MSKAEDYARKHADRRVWWRTTFPVDMTVYGRVIGWVIPVTGLSLGEYVMVEMESDSDSNGLPLSSFGTSNYALVVPSLSIYRDATMVALHHLFLDNPLPAPRSDRKSTCYCGSNAYITAFTVECNNSVCRHYKP